mgnify:CR=1 FL=1
MTKPTSELVKVVDIRNNVYVLENGGLRAVVQVSGLNFSLASAREQDLIISSFKSFLDGIDFNLQILILSRYANIDKYLNLLKERAKEENEPLIRFQLEEYMNFIKEYVATHHVMQKFFYIIVPYDSPSVEAGFKIPGLSQKASIKEEEFNEKLQQLDVRVSYVVSSMSTLGMSAKVLTNEELLILLFELINPSIYWQTVPREVFEALTKI